MSSDQAALLGIPDQFEFEGELYQVAERSFEHEGLFSRWVAQQGYLDIQRHKGVMTPDEYERQMTGWRHDCATRVYEFGMPITTAAMFSPSGMKYLAYLALKEKSPKVTESLIDRIYKDDDKWAELWSIMGALNDPNSKTPATKEEKPAPTQTTAAADSTTTE